MQAADVVRRVAASDEFARFELAEDLTGHHHHLLCTGCGKVTDIPTPDAFERAVNAHLRPLADARGFQPRSHRVDVFGLCNTCQ